MILSGVNNKVVGRNKHIIISSCKTAATSIKTFFKIIS